MHDPVKWKKLIPGWCFTKDILSILQLNINCKEEKKKTITVMASVYKDKAHTIKANIAKGKARDPVWLAAFFFVGFIPVASMIRLYFLRDIPVAVCFKFTFRPELASSLSRQAHTIQTSVLPWKFNTGQKELVWTVSICLGMPWGMEKALHIWRCHPFYSLSVVGG